jgi:transposase-like protein
MLGATSKPRDSAAQWREIVQGQVQSGLSVAAHCRRARVPQSSFYAWRRKLRRSASFTEVRFALEPPRDAGAIEVRLTVGPLGQ